MGGTPQDFGLELLAPDLKRMLPKLELPTSATPASRRSASSRTPLGAASTAVKGYDLPEC
ncbi:MAG: hypothetical protein QGF03_05115 [SAR324 cluster bacterium]|nr:hypothetical protein [SAR324 cluster bacterium]